jgi:hypothetical protein
MFDYKQAVLTRMPIVYNKTLNRKNETSDPMMHLTQPVMRVSLGSRRSSP